MERVSPDIGHRHEPILFVDHADALDGVGGEAVEPLEGAELRAGDDPAAAQDEDGRGRIWKPVELRLADVVGQLPLS
jgi:hypothetical protein